MSGLFAFAVYPTGTVRMALCVKLNEASFRILGLIMFTA
jgi:hypothetical protein